MNNGDLWLMALKRPFVRKRPSQEEYRLQVSIVKYLSLKQNQKKDFIFFAVPNGEKRDQVTAAKLKAAGVLSGVSVHHNIQKTGYHKIIHLHREPHLPALPR